MKNKNNNNNNYYYYYYYYYYSDNHHNNNNKNKNNNNNNNNNVGHHLSMFHAQKCHREAGTLALGLSLGNDHPTRSKNQGSEIPRA